MTDDKKPERSEEWLTYKEVCASLRIARSTLNVYIGAGRIPRPVHFSPRNVRWRAEALADIFANGPGEPGTYSEDNVTDEGRAQLRAITAELPPVESVQAAVVTPGTDDPVDAQGVNDFAEQRVVDDIARLIAESEAREAAQKEPPPAQTLPMERLCELHPKQPATPRPSRSSARRKKPAADELAADEARAKAREEEYLADLERRAAEVEAQQQPGPEATEPAPARAKKPPAKRKKPPAKREKLPEEPAAAIDCCEHGHPEGFYCWLCEQKKDRELYERQQKAGEQPKPRRRKKQ